MCAYEYRILETNAAARDKLEIGMNSFGNEGFKVISVIPYTDETPSLSPGGSRTNVVVVMEREKDVELQESP